MVEISFTYIVKKVREAKVPNLNRPRWSNKLIFAEKSEHRWLVPIFVVALCTNLVLLVPAHASDAVLTPITKISTSLTNQEITVRAAITGIREPSSGHAPYIVTLAEGGTTIPLVYWSDLQPGVASKVKNGNVIQAKVLVSVYRDHLELRLRSADALELVSATATTTNVPVATTTSEAISPPPTAGSPPPSTATVIGKIKADWVGRVVIISGTVSGFQDTPQGRQFAVDDATGEIPMLLGQKILDGLSASQLQQGRALTVTGPIALSDGKPIVVPESASAVKLVTQ
jgi:hypothetical protein